MLIDELPTETGARLLTLSALLGAAVSLDNYLTPLRGIDGTPGALLVVLSSLILFAVGLALYLVRMPKALRILLIIGCAAGIVGTAFAAYLLESQALLVLMGLCLLGWGLNFYTARHTLS